MSINYISNPVYVPIEQNTYNYIYSSTLHYRYKKYPKSNVYLKLKYNDQGRFVKSITI
jgi:hypothetical protein